uniref:Protein ALP1-like n=1 Tax=Tanacetum cinerariifolium TaxID=118510 RepID=A0A6L2J2R3_TANCI|nr:protein ALP1-like [Tanacetum cinerariifolium]
MAERLPPGSYDLDSIKIPNGLEPSSILLNSDTNGDDQPKSSQVNSSYLTSPMDASSASVNEALSPTGTFSGFSETKEPIRMSNGNDAYSDVSSLNGAGVDVGNKYMSDCVASQEAQNNGFKPRSPTSNSGNTYNAPDQVEAEWIEQYEPGVYITLVALRDGTRDLKRVRFRKPTLEDVENIYNKHLTTHGFPGMLGNIECMHREWKNCPVSWQGQYGRGDKKYLTIMLEAVASQDLWIWHAFFGVAGANNDINVLDNSPLFDDLLDDKAPVAPNVVNGVGFEKGYYLADGIYPQWATFVKSFTVANDAKHALKSVNKVHGKMSNVLLVFSKDVGE